MEVLEAFVLNEKEHNVNIRWDGDIPLFKASEIATILGIKNVSKSMSTFNPSQKVIISSNTPRRCTKCVFLTEKGLYRLHKQDWVTDVIISIRTTGKYEISLKEAESKIRVELTVKTCIRTRSHKNKKTY